MSRLVVPAREHSPAQLPWRTAANSLPSIILHPPHRTYPPVPQTAMHSAPSGLLCPQAPTTGRNANTPRFDELTCPHLATNTPRRGGRCVQDCRRHVWPRHLTRPKAKPRPTSRSPAAAAPQAWAAPRSRRGRWPTTAGRRGPAMWGGVLAGQGELRGAGLCMGGG